jgi:hypothetical protein
LLQLVTDIITNRLRRFPAHRRFTRLTAGQTFPANRDDTTE